MPKEGNSQNRFQVVLEDDDGAYKIRIMGFLFLWLKENRRNQASTHLDFDVIKGYFIVRCKRNV